MVLSRLLRRRINCSGFFLFRIPVTAAGFFSTAPESSQQSVASTKPSSLSARLNLIFDQIDEIDKNRQEKDETLQRIRAWRESKKKLDDPVPEPSSSSSSSSSEESGSLEKLNREVVKSESVPENGDVIKRDVELVHPWPEWIELMERLVQQNYFDHRRKDEDGMLEGLGIQVPDAESKEESLPANFAQHFKTVQTAMVNFGRDRFDILRALSRQDLQILVGYGCPSADKRVVFSGKLLRKLTHLDEGDVCSSCSLRGSCEKAYLLTNKEDEARTIDVMRILLTYGFAPIDGSVTNKALLNMKPVKAVIRKLLHQVVKLSAVPIDPNLPPPVIKRPPPKVKQPPPPPKKRVGRYDVEMKKGDWLCIKCSFLNFAKNTACLQCEAKRPKRQLLPGEWECPQCNFLNYRRNTVCFHCEHSRPLDTYTEREYPEKQHRQDCGGIRTMDKVPDRASVSNAWNFDFDDDESDGADVAAFEYADSQKTNEGGGGFSGSGNATRRSADSGRVSSPKPFVGFDDFEDEEDVDSYEMVAPNESRRNPGSINLSELESDDSEDETEIRGGRSSNADFDTDDDLPAVNPEWRSSRIAGNPRRQRREKMSYGSDDDDLSSEDDERVRSKKGRRGQRSMNTGNNTRRGGQDRRSNNHRHRPRDDDDDDDDSYSEAEDSNKRRIRGSGRGSFSRGGGGGKFDGGGRRRRGRGSSNLEQQGSYGVDDGVKLRARNNVR